MRLWPAAALIVIAFLSLLGLQSYQAFERSPQIALSRNRVAQTFAVISAIDALNTALQDAERGQRGYLLTGSSKYLAPYRSAVVRIPQLMARVGALSAQETRQRERLSGLERQIDLKMAEMAHTIAAYRRGGRGAALSIVRSNEGFDAMHAIGTQIDSMVATENSLLQRSLAREAAEERTSRRIALASVLLASFLMICGLILVAVSFARSRRLQGEIARRAEEASHANARLQKMNLELEHAVAQARESRETAMRAERTKSRFLATASHDLRQPLQVLSLLNGALRRKVRDPSLAEVLGEQDRAIDTMSRLLNALLDISKLESGAVRPEVRDFDVAALLAGMGREFRALAARKGLQLQIDPCTLYAHSDPSLVEQILRNLLSNAVKYTAVGSVRLRAAKDASFVRIDVIDSGIGIPADQIVHVGEEFHQIGVPSNSAREGYGLGLSIVRRLVRLLDLTLEVKSELGQGSTFSLWLHQGAKPPESERAAAEAGIAQENAAGKRQILLIEDDPGVRSATRMMLEVEGYGVAVAASVEEALRAARGMPSIDLLLSDFHLADGETGLQAIRAVREARQATLKAILITGDTSSAVKELPRDPHLRVVSKPVRVEQLLALAHELWSPEPAAT